MPGQGEVGRWNLHIACFDAACSCVISLASASKHLPPLLICPAAALVRCLAIGAWKRTRCGSLGSCEHSREGTVGQLPGRAWNGRPQLPCNPFLQLGAPVCAARHLCSSPLLPSPQPPVEQQPGWDDARAGAVS